MTNFAPACYAMWEQDINPIDTLNIQKAMPSVYKLFKHKELFSYGNFILWFIKGVAQSLIIYYVSLFAINSGAIKSDGFVNDMWQMSIMAYTSTFAVIMLELFIETNNFTRLVNFFYWILAIILYFPCFVFVWDQFSSNILEYYAADMFIYGKFWLVVLLNMAICGTYSIDIDILYIH